MKALLGNCSYCGEQVEFDEPLVGREAECPFCNEHFVCESNGAIGASGGLSGMKIMMITAVSVFAVAGAVGGGMKILGGKGGDAKADGDGAMLVASADSEEAPSSSFGGSSSGSSSRSSAGGTGMGMDNSMGMGNSMGGMEGDMGMEGSMGGMEGGMGMGGMDNAMAAADGAGPTFNKDVLPILQSRCTDCHGADKQKARLRLDSLGAVRSGAGGDAVIQPGNSGSSTLFQRVSLPPNHDDVMPPKGGSLSGAQKDLIKRWIDSGAR